jgi:NADPH-dependent 2,4-dienoyl-CoA reductase/sulfur reductase-like enzyme
MLVFLLTLVLLVHLDSFRVLRVRSRRSLTLSARGKARLPDLSAPKFPDVPENGYDLVVFGSGPAGEACAVQAAKLGARVAVIEQKAQFGGPTGLSSKAFREATKVLVRAIDTIGGDRRRQIRALWRRRFPAIKSEAEG